MKQYFKFNNADEQIQLTVLAQMSYKYDAQSIQISKVKELETNEVKFVYEEITDDTDEVVYARYMSEENIRNNYPWAVTMLPCKPLTKKQQEMMRHINDYLRDVDDNDTISIEYFVAALMEENENLTVKGIEGVLSSLWVKGYIRCNVLAGSGTRYFVLEPFGVEYLKSIRGEGAEQENDDEENAEEA